MLDVLEQVESVLPQLLLNDGWQSLDVDYHDPRVEIVWRQYDDYRICLHVIHPCKDNKDDSLFHPHPWPSAMRVLSGTYEMAIGYGKGLDRPPEACRMRVRVGVPANCSQISWSKSQFFVYEMLDPDGWHSVHPIDDVCYSLMISGKPWNRETEGSDKPLQPLTTDRMAKILRWYRLAYPVDGVLRNPFAS